MKIFIKSLLFSLFMLFVLFIRSASASEGEFQINDLSGEPARCYAVSLLMADGKYQILLGCRDLLFPPEGKIGSYTLWARSVSDGKNFRLGSIGIGKATFSTKEPFSELFITLETNDKIKSPSGSVLMRGDINRIEYLDRRGIIQNDERITPTEIPNQEEVTPTPKLSTKQKLLIGIKRSGIIAGVALIGLIGLILIISRSRG